MGTHAGRLAVISMNLVLAVGGLALGGCGSAGPAGNEVTAGPALPSAGAACPDQVGDGHPVRFGADGYLAGVLLGVGATGVVLGHMYGSDLCEWLPEAHLLASRGYRVLAIDFADNGSSGAALGGRHLSDDMAEAAGYLRANGVTSVVLVGASMGGTAALVAAATVTPTVTAVVSFSGPTNYGGMDAGAEVRTLTVPALYLVGDADSAGSFAADARTMAHATPAGLATLLVAPSSAHGAALLAAGPTGDRVNRAFDTFLAAHAPPAP